MSKLIRRTHLYLALFLGPWILMYAVSTFVMNHRTWFRGTPPAPPRWETVSESLHAGEFPPGADRGQMARQILASLEMDGAHQATLRDGVLTIQRMEAVRPVRITYRMADRGLKVERQVYENAAFLERMHRRRGFQHAYAQEDLWAFSVDFFIVTVVFWALSGLWLWWELRGTRRWGAAALGLGSALFAFFAAVL